MKTYQYILLDWDGNIAQTLHIWLEACRTPLLKRGLELSDEEIAASFGDFPAHCKQWGIKDIDATLEEADTIAKSRLPDVELYPDALEVLQNLQDAGKKLALITTSFRSTVTRQLEKYDMLQLFDAIITGDDVTHHKPHPEPLEKGLAALGGSKDQAVMIGDSDKDLGAAVNAGVDSILFFPPEHKKFYDLNQLKELKPTHVVADFRQILDLV